jgi:hypothetical protein
MFAIATTRARFQAMRLGVVRRRQQHRRRTIDHAGRIAGMMHEIDLEVGILLQNQASVGRALVIEWIVRHRGESGLQTGEAFERGLRSRIFFTIECKAAILAANRNQATVEVTALDGAGRPLLTLQTQRIDVLPRDAFERRNRVGADPLMRLRVPGAQPEIAGVHHERAFAAAPLHRHHFGAAGDDQILRARHDGGSRHVDAGDAGAAEAIERDAAGAHVITGIERRHPAEIAALRAALGAGTPDDVVDIGGIDSGALRQRPQHRGAQLLRMDARQRALAGLADASRRSAGVDDQCVDHGASFHALVARIWSRPECKVNSCRAPARFAIDRPVWYGR